jgi:molybdopterin-guanine dinucleotide biosynthesis protein A
MGKSKEFTEFEKAARPLMEWIAKNYDPHTKVIITSDRAEILQEKMAVVTEDYIQD